MASALATALGDIGTIAEDVVGENAVALSEDVGVDNHGKVGDAALEEVEHIACHIVGAHCTEELLAELPGHERS